VAADEGGVEHAGHDDVVDVLPVPGEQAGVLPSSHRLADEPSGGGGAHDGLEPSRGSGWAASRVAGFACTPISRPVGVSPGTYSPSPCDSADAAPLGGQGPSVSSTC